MSTVVRNRFYRVLSEAIADFTEHGFDSQERLDRWVRELKQAAVESLVPESVLTKALNEALGREFRRATDPRTLQRRHRAVPFFKLEQVKPRLRSELDRRILASASLIRLNRDASVERTLQRFVGWSTSIPSGGTRAVDKRETNEDIRRSIAGLPFEERRVIIDQGHKLAAAINDIIATDAGAIVMTWHHVMEGGGYQARPEHVARNDEIFVVRGNWALEAGLMKLAGRKYTDQVDQPAEKPYCRCWWEAGYTLRDLPPEMLTAAGREQLAAARKQIASHMTERAIYV